MDLARLRDLIKVATESGAAEVEIEERGVRILVRSQSTPVVLQAPYMLPLQPGMMPSSVQQQPGYMPQIGTPQPDTSPVAPPAVEEQPVEASSEPKGTVIRAPIVGTFFRSPSPDAETFVEVGTTVAAGDTLCIIEAMKNMNEIESEVAGTIKEILVRDAEPVSYDQPLFVIS